MVDETSILFVDSRIVNAYISYKEILKNNNTRKKPMSHLKFLSLLAEQLVGNCKKTQVIISSEIILKIFHIFTRKLQKDVKSAVKEVF